MRIFGTSWSSVGSRSCTPILPIGAPVASNTVVGYTAVSNGTYRGFVWRNGQTSLLPTLGGDSCSADDVNARGEIVGLAADASNDNHATLWRDGEPIDLGTLGPPGDISEATAINNRGTAVGWSPLEGRPVGASHAVVWQGSTPRDLTDRVDPGAGWTHYSATAINTRGQIVGGGAHDGRSTAFLLTPRGGP